MTHLKYQLSLLKNRAFAAYVLSCIFVTFGAGITAITNTWLIMSVDTSVAAVTLNMLCFWLPTVILGPLFGVLADRYSRKTLIIISNVLRATYLLGYVYIISQYKQYTVLNINLLTLAMGTGFGLCWPAVTSYIRDIIPQHDLLYANATMDIAFEVGNVLGLGSAGLLMGLLSIKATYLINASCFVIATFCISSIQPIQTNKPKRVKGPLLQEWLDGLRYLKDRPSLCLLYTVQLILLLQFLTAPALLAPFAKSILHTSAIQFGLLESMMAAGVLLGGAIMPMLSVRYGITKVISLASLFSATCFVLFSYNHSFHRAEVLYLGVGFALALWAVLLTECQNMTDNVYQGRVQSCFNSISSLCAVLMYTLLNLGSHFLSIQDVYRIEAVLSIVILIGIQRYKKDHSGEALEEKQIEGIESV